MSNEETHKQTHPLFSFSEYRRPQTYVEMSDDQFAVFAALSSERDRGRVESKPGSKLDRFYFTDGKEVKEVLARYGVNKENVDDILFGFEEAGWIELFLVEEGIEIVIFNDANFGDHDNSVHSLDDDHDRPLCIQIRSYVLDKFEEICPGHQRPQLS